MGDKKGYIYLQPAAAFTFGECYICVIRITMKKTIVLLALCLPLVMFTQCAKKMVTTKTAAAPNDAAADIKAKYSTAQIAEGKVIFEGSCGKCHKLRQPAEFKVSAWEDILPRMCKKAKLDADKAALVRAWVITNAKVG